MSVWFFEHPYQFYSGKIKTLSMEKDHLNLTFMVLEESPDYFLLKDFYKVLDSQDHL